MRALASALSPHGGTVRAYGVLSPARRGLNLPLAQLGVGIEGPIAELAAGVGAPTLPGRTGANSLAIPFSSLRRARPAPSAGDSSWSDVKSPFMRSWESDANRQPAAALASAGGGVPASLLPSLGNLAAAGYSVEPPLSALRSLTEEELASVSGFVVVRSGHGSVAWIDDVDVRGLRLDGTLAIEGGPACPRPRGAPAVEPGAEVVARRAPALDARARVTLFGLEPPAGTDERDFGDALRQRCELHGATFVDYTPAEGWRLRFDVPGFS